MASDTSDAPRMVGDPHLLIVGEVEKTQRLPDGAQEVGLLGDWGVFQVAPIEYTIRVGDTLFVYGDGSWIGCPAISHVRINDGPPTPQLPGYRMMRALEAQWADSDKSPAAEQALSETIHRMVKGD